MTNRAIRFLADPARLNPVRREDGILQVIIETPRGSRNKYSFDSEQEIFALKKVLPTGMLFPYDFGFLPSTKAEDGDPIDVLVLMDEPAYPGCLVRARLLGVMEGEQEESGKKFRNDRLLAVAESTHMYAHLQTIQELPKDVIQGLEEFFVSYNKLQGKKYKPLGCKGEEKARELIKSAQQAAA